MHLRQRPWAESNAFPGASGPICTGHARNAVDLTCSCFEAVQQHTRRETNELGTSCAEVAEIAEIVAEIAEMAAEIAEIAAEIAEIAAEIAENAAEIAEM
eukprot:2747449-Rhodomonas_salina.5